MLFLLKILRVMPYLLFNGNAMKIYTPYGVVPLALNAGEISEIHVPDFHSILTFKHMLRKVSYRLVDLLDSTILNFAPLPLIVRFNISREIQKSDKRATILGHRGSGTDAYRRENNLPFIPENTIESFQQAFEDGAEWAEMDIHMTSDGEIVIHHDYKVGDRPIWNMTLSEFKKRAPRQPTFSQVLSELDQRVKILLEFKYPSAEEVTDSKLGSAPDLESFVETVLKILRKQLHARVLRIMAFEPEILLRLKEADEELDLFFLTEGLPDKHADRRRNSYDEAIQFCTENDFQGVVTDTDTINSDPVELIAAAHEAGLQLMVYWWRTLLNGNDIMVSEIVNFDCASIDGLIVDNIPMARTILSNMQTCVWTRGGDESKTIFPGVDNLIGTSTPFLRNC